MDNRMSHELEFETEQNPFEFNSNSEKLDSIEKTEDIIFDLRAPSPHEPSELINKLNSHVLVFHHPRQIGIGKPGSTRDNLAKVKENLSSSHQTLFKICNLTEPQGLSVIV